MIKQLIASSTVLAAATLLLVAQARPVEDDEYVATIPSPNQDFNDEYSSLAGSDIQRTNHASSQLEQTTKATRASEPQQAEPSNEASIPVYVSPFARAERATLGPARQAIFESGQESSHAPPNYAPRPSAGADLKASASYGHHHGHHGGYHGYEPSGWLDMGAWTGGKGSFGWYADYPVGGGKHHYGYGRR